MPDEQAFTGELVVTVTAVATHPPGTTVLPDGTLVPPTDDTEEN